MVDNKIPNLFPLPNNPPGPVIFNGKININEAELSTIKKLQRFGEPIIKLEESGIKGIRRPDILWFNKEWEIKTISGVNPRNIYHAIYHARTQSENIILDILKTKLPKESILREVKNNLKRFRDIKNILVIIKDNYCILNRNMLK